jgi:enoyl-[acyl-carrier protein] reductase III
MIDAPAPIHLSGWALVLGASSGFGAATALALAAAGLDVVGVHLDRRATLPAAARVAAAVERLGRRAQFFNVNAADADRRAEVVTALERALGETGRPAGLRVLLHSLAFGTLKPYVADDPKDAVTPAQLGMTLEVMAHSLVYWTQDVVARGLMGRDGRVFAMTSAGGARALPHYGAVSAAKAALESHVRQLAVELAPRGITVNAIRAGVTATPAAQKIPGYASLEDDARRRNPSGRLTTPDDVARAIVALSHEATAWITGNVIGVDGGEDIVG